MPTRSPFTIAERLNMARVAITNSLAEAEIQTLVAAYGYAATKLNEGKALYDAAATAFNAQKSAEGAQQQATQDTVKAETAARDAYQALAKVARAIFKTDQSRLTALGLNGSAPETTAGFLAAAFRNENSCLLLFYAVVRSLNLRNIAVPATETNPPEFLHTS